MYETYSIGEKFKLYFKILIPLIITEMSFLLISLSDTLMTARLEPYHLAGVSIGFSFYLIISSLGGILLAINPIISRNIATDDKKNIASIIFQGIYISIGIFIVTLILKKVLFNNLLSNMNLNENVFKVAINYTNAMAWAILPEAIYLVLSYFIIATGKSKIIMGLSFISLGLNIFLNYIFIFGNLGMPALGGYGAGIASTITRYVSVSILIFIIYKNNYFKKYNLFSKLYSIDKKTITMLLVIGIPLAISEMLDGGGYSVTTMIMGAQFDEYVVSATEIAENIHMIFFAVTVCMGTVATSLISFEIGAKRWKDAKEYGIIILSTAILFGVIAMVISIVCKKPLLCIFTTNSKVLDDALVFLTLSGVLIFLECIIMPMKGILVAFNEAKFNNICDLFCFWVFGIVLGIFLSRYTVLGKFGYMAGLIIGMITSSIMLSAKLLWVKFKIKRELKGNKDKDYVFTKLAMNE